MMSFIGSIAALVNGSGPSECLETALYQSRQNYLQHSFLPQTLKVEQAEAEDNGEINDMNPDIVDEGITNKN